MLILDDDHVFKRWAAAGSQSRILRSFFAGGAESAEFRRELALLDALRWREDRL